MTGCQGRLQFPQGSGRLVSNSDVLSDCQTARLSRMQSIGTLGDTATSNAKRPLEPFSLDGGSSIFASAFSQSNSG